MRKYIDADKLKAEIERLQKRAEHYEEISLTDGERSYWSGENGALELLATFIAHLQQEQPDFPTTDEEVEKALASIPKVELPDKYKTPDWLFQQQEQQETEMKSPFTGGKVAILSREEEVTFRGEKVKILRKYYHCEDTGREFTNSKLDDDMMWAVFRAYCEKKGMTSFTDIMLKQEQPIKVYRVENEKEQKGLWRKFDGTWEPLFDMLTDGQCKDMPMGDSPIYREGGKQWFASAPSRETLQKWFSKKDLEELTAKGFTISEFEVVGYRKVSDFEYIFTRDNIIGRKYLCVDDIFPEEQPEVDLEKFTEKIKTFQARYKYPEIVSVKGAMAFMARMFYQYPNVARQWYEQLPKATMD